MQSLFHPYCIEMIHLSMIKYYNYNYNNNNINEIEDKENNQSFIEKIAKKYEQFEPISWIDEELPYLQKYGKQYNTDYDFSTISKLKYEYNDNTKKTS